MEVCDNYFYSIAKGKQKKKDKVAGEEGIC